MPLGLCAPGVSLRAKKMKRTETLRRCVALAAQIFGDIRLTAFSNREKPGQYLIGIADRNDELEKALTPRFKPSELLAYLQGIKGQSLKNN